MYFPEMPQDLLKQIDEAVIFDEQYTPFLLEINFEANEMFLSQRELPKTDQYLEDQCKYFKLSLNHLFSCTDVILSNHASATIE